LDKGLLFYLSCVLALGVAAQWLAWRLRLPSILLLLLGGMGLGQALAGRLDITALLPDKLLFPIVSLSVAVILFEGGLTLRLSELRDAGGSVFRLVTLGALITWIAAAAAGVWILDLDPRLAALLGAILVVTGPTVVAPLLRQIRPSRRIGSVLKWEGIVIDPIGAVLAVLVYEFVVTSSLAEGARHTIISIAMTITVGALIGGLAAILLVQIVRHYLAPDFLHVPIFLGVAVLAFTISNRLQAESGLLTVTVLGIWLANQKTVTVKHVVEFKENLQVLLIGCLFIALGSRVDLSALYAVRWQVALFIGLLIFVVRPASVYLATLGSQMNWREKTFLAFLAPRGIVAASVASIFALELSARADLPEVLREQAALLAPLTFGVILGTVSVYGVVAGPLARRLRLAATNPQGVLIAGADAGIQNIALMLQKEDIAVLLVDSNYSNIAAARLKGLPAECANILAEYVHEELDLSGLGYLLAMTANDDVNTLAVVEMSHIFGRANVYQVAPTRASAARRMAVAPHLRGRVLFDARMTHDELGRRLHRGQELKRTQISEEFPFESFRERYGESAVVLFVWSETGRLLINTVEKPLVPAAGQTVLALVEPANEN
jgi:NhaP-type Na+/H+ or K+/H+ antiporter